jgi:hypothetical protein
MASASTAMSISTLACPKPTMTTIPSTFAQSRRLTRARRCRFEGAGLINR